MTNNPARIDFHELTPVSLRNRRTLKEFLFSVFRHEKQHLQELTIVFCDDPYLLDLNRRFLNHDFYTDILSFALSGPKEALTAEIYISVDRVKENARTAKTTFQEELHRVVFHGVLHLCGYTDKSVGAQRLMRSKEDACLKSYFRNKNHGRRK
jgi:probable rRNA maturation factor